MTIVIHGLKIKKVKLSEIAKIKEENIDLKEKLAFFYHLERAGNLRVFLNKRCNKCNKNHLNCENKYRRLLQEIDWDEKS